MSEDMPEEPVEVTNSNFDEVINKYPLVVVDCWAGWCGPCKMMDPVLENVAEEMQGEAVIGKLNVDENKDMASEFGVSSIPTYLVFKDGEQVDRFMGAMDKQAFEEKMQSYT